MRAGLHRYAKLEGLQDFPRALLPTLLRGFGPADSRCPDPRLIEAHVELLRFGGDPHDAAIRSTLVQPQLERVLAIDRELVANRQSTPRSPRQVLAEASPLVAIRPHEDRLRRPRFPHTSYSPI